MADGREQTDHQGLEEVYLCPICDTRVTSTTSECPGCGAIFADDEAAVPPPEEGPAPAEGGPEDALPLEYRCPECGASVAEDDASCPRCGAQFLEEGEVPEDELELEPAKEEVEAPAAEPEPEAFPPEPEPEPEAPRVVRTTRRTEAKRAVEKARGRDKEPAIEPGPLEGLKLEAAEVEGRPSIAATRRRDLDKVRHSKAVRRLSKRRKLIAQRRMVGLSTLGLGFVVYILSLLLTKPEGFTLGVGAVLGVAMVLMIVGVLIIYNQHHAWRHYQGQLQTARIEAALLRDKERSPASKEARAPRAAAAPKAAKRPASGRARAAPRSVPSNRPAEAVDGGAEPQRRVVTGAAEVVAEKVRPESVVVTPEEEVEVEPEEPRDKDKVPCPNCGYMNRSIFVRCIRCGTELATRDESISVETFERPEEPEPGEERRPRGSPMPWEARHASSQMGRSAARQAARRTAKVEEEEEPTGGEDRRAAIGVAANFTKLPKNMREELIRTLYKVSDPVVRQDTVSAIAEHYTELPKDIQDLLIDLADDKDPRVREEVAFEVNRNFDRIPLDVIKPIFSKLVKDPENLVREDVVSAITENFQRLPKETQDLLKVLATDSNESVRDEVSFEVAKNSDVIPEKFKSEVKELLRRASG